jgi:Fibronectin type III domain
MSDLPKQQFFLPRTRVTGAACIPLRLTAIVAGLLLMMMPFLSGCGGDGEGQASTPADTGITASLAWHPVQDPSVIAYFVHYGRQSPNQPGSCAYESSMHVTSPSATVTNLDPDTRYYFTVSAYNGLESACSHEVSTITPSVSVQTDRPSPPFRPSDEMLTRPDVFPDVSRMPGQRPL